MRTSVTLLPAPSVCSTFFFQLTPTFSLSWRVLELQRQLGYLNRHIMFAGTRGSVALWDPWFPLSLPPLTFLKKLPGGQSKISRIASNG